MPAELPHFALPFRFEPAAGGGLAAAENEQDSTAAVAACVECIVRTEVGQRTTLPEFGRPALEFSTDPDVARAQLQAAIDANEPRVRAMVEAAELDPRDSLALQLLAMYSPAEEEDAP
jgi:hypothetical protein